MDSQASIDDQLVTRSEIAGLVGLRRPAITNWESRHHDFPKPVRAGGEVSRDGWVGLALVRGRGRWAWAVGCSLWRLMYPVQREKSSSLHERCPWLEERVLMKLVRVCAS